MSGRGNREIDRISRWVFENYGQSVGSVILRELLNAGRRTIVAAWRDGTLGEIAQHLAGEIAGTLPSLNPQGPSAVPPSSMADAPVSGVTRRRQVQSGTYIGPFKRPKRPSRPGSYAIAGFRGEHEFYGTYSSSQCLYIGASSVVPRRIGIAVGVALLRKIMKKHYNITYSDVRQKFIPWVVETAPGSTSSVEYAPVSEIRWVRRDDHTYLAGAQPPNNDSLNLDSPIVFAYGNNTDTATVKYFYNTTTLLDMGEKFADHVFLNTSYGGGHFGSTDYHPNRYSLFGYQLWNRTASGGTGSYALFGVEPVHNMIVKAYSTVRFHLQNVTLADDSGTGAVESTANLTTRLDANPVKGCMFYFKDRNPIVSDPFGSDHSAPADQAQLLMFVNGVHAGETTGNETAGLIKPYAALGHSWSQVPECDAFANCKGYRRVALDPGTIRDTSIKFSFDGTIQKLMNGLRGYGPIGNNPVGYPSGSYSTLGSNTDGTMGTSFLFALEKRMPTGESGVTVNYQYENYYGAVIKKQLPTTMDKFAQAGVADQ